MIRTNAFLGHIREAVEETAMLMEAEAKRKAPVEIGYHRQNIKGAVTRGNPYTARISANADYAPYLEFGTGGLVDVPKGFEDFAMQFKGKGIRTVNLLARPHIIPAAYKGMDFLERQIVKAIDKL